MSKYDNFHFSPPFAARSQTDSHHYFKWNFFLRHTFLIPFILMTFLSFAVFLFWFFCGRKKLIFFLYFLCMLFFFQFFSLLFQTFHHANHGPNSEPTLPLSLPLLLSLPLFQDIRNSHSDWGKSFDFFLEFCTLLWFQNLNSKYEISE